MAFTSETKKELENYNKSKKENPEVKQCPQEKVEYIKDALKHFGLINKNI